MKDFTVGKFYKVSVGWNGKFVPALCTRILKRRIYFQYLSKEVDGTIHKVTEWRSLRKATESSHARAYDATKWSMLVTTTADMEANKPGIWDNVGE